MSTKVAGKHISKRMRGEIAAKMHSWPTRTEREKVAGFTRGPWAGRFANDHISDGRGNRQRVFGVWGPEGDCVAVCKAVVADNEANARLIASAPEMLEALREMLRQFEPADPDNDNESDAIVLAWAAIRKAEGL